MKCHISSYCETVVATCSFIQDDEGEGTYLWFLFISFKVHEKSISWKSCFWEEICFSGEFEKLSEPKNGCNVVLSLDRPLFVPNESFYIASKLEQQGKVLFLLYLFKKKFYLSGLSLRVPWQFHSNYQGPKQRDQPIHTKAERRKDRKNWRGKKKCHCDWTFQKGVQYRGFPEYEG